MTADDLKITILRASKPGDVLFFHIDCEITEEVRELMVAIRDYLQPMGITPVMLPPTVTLVGSMFEAVEPPAPETDPEIMRLRQENETLRSTINDARLETVRGCTEGLRTIAIMAQENQALRNRMPVDAKINISESDATPLTDAAMTDGFTGCDLAIPVEFAQRLERENRALRNLAANLRPGPISEALGGVEHERSYREAVSPPRICKYTQSESGSMLWLTECNREFYLSNSKELLAYCGHCGGEVEEVGAEQSATPGAMSTGEDSVRQHAESSRPRELP